jgi:hypothetical protein
MKTHLKLISSNQIEDIYPKFVASYEIFYFGDGKIEVWRSRVNRQPEEACPDRWLSDFGVGYYDKARALSKEVKFYKNYMDLPSSIKRKIKPANQSEMDLVKVVKQPKLKVINSKNLNWFKIAIKKILNLDFLD